MKNNTMKYLLLLLLPALGYGQYSTYYGRVDVNANVNVNKNINVSGNVNKTVRTIDYGALANANALRERNRIEKLKISSFKDKEALIAIANDPSKAYDFGEKIEEVYIKMVSKNSGLKYVKHSYQKPHKFLFNPIGETKTQYLKTIDFINVSDNFIKTKIVLKTLLKIDKVRKFQRKDLQKKYNGVFLNLEEYVKYPDLIVGKYNDTLKYFIHKKEINKTITHSEKGFKGTVWMEDDYEYVVEDNYYAVNDEVLFIASVTYSGDKDEVTFEEIEGRRYYFRKLTDMIISTSSFDYY